MSRRTGRSSETRRGRSRSASPTDPSGTAARRFRLTAVLISLLIGAAAGIAISIGDGGDGGSTRSITSTVGSYRIVYRVEDHGDGTSLVSIEELVVARPYRSRRTRWPSDDRGEPPELVTVSDFGVTSSRQANSPDLTRVAPPAPAAGDLLLEHTLSSLTASGVLEHVGPDRVLNTRCETYRTREPIGAGLVLAPTADEWVDSCVDHRGLLLSERWHLGGRLFQSRTAVVVDVDPDLTERWTEAFTPLAAPEIAGRLTRTSRAPAWAIRAPESFVHRGRYELSIPTGEPDADDPSRPAPPRASLVDVYERDTDVVIVEVGSADARVDRSRRPFHLDVPGVDYSSLEPTGVGYELVALTTDGTRVVLRATVDRTTVVRIARSLRPAAA